MLGILVYRLLLRKNAFLALCWPSWLFSSADTRLLSWQPFCSGTCCWQLQHGKPLRSWLLSALWQLAHLLDPTGRQCAIEQGQTDFTRFGLGGRFGRLCRAGPARRPRPTNQKFSSRYPQSNVVGMLHSHRHAGNAACIPTPLTQANSGPGQACSQPTATTPGFLLAALILCWLRWARSSRG